MEIFNDISLYTDVNPVATIGIFDGVHRGHVEILKRIRELAAEYNSKSAVLTFWPHPRSVLQPEHKNKLRLLTSLDEKVKLIAGNEIDHLIILPFTADLSNIPFDLFVKDYLVKKIQVRHLVMGFNHHFGKDRKGSYGQLVKMAGEFGFKVEKLGPVVINENRVSSSGIRHMIENGRIKAANEALGYNYFIKGKVVRGNRLGSKLGFPTANIEPDEPHKLIPLNGVYAVNVAVNRKSYRGMLNIGVRPTIAMPRHEKTIEVNMFDFNSDLYGQSIQIQFLEWMRWEKKFSTLEELREQIETDKREVLNLFKTI